MTIEVSVVVPVYNPGEFIRPLLDSLDRQTLGWDRFEAVFVDDGSTDGTGEVLDRWATERPHATVVHQDNHGWPGQPRNVGIDHSSGTFVQFVDQDDWLGDEALERLVAYADENDSDVVVGKMVGIERSVPNALFRRSIPRAHVARGRLNSSQTPHKMFRRAFLDRIGLRFPEGKRRLEDHLFVTTAYLRADVVSVYADYDCYFHIRRPDGGNAGFRRYDPAQYYANLEEVIDVIDEWLPAGRNHDRYLSRWIRSELVGRACSEDVRSLPRPEREAFYQEISRIMRERIPLSAVRRTTTTRRLGAVLLRHATMDEFTTILDHLDRMRFRARVHGDALRVTATRDGRTLTADTTLSSLLGEVGSAELAEAVVADLGRDDDVLPKRVALLRADGRRVLAREARTDAYRGSVAPRDGDPVRVSSLIGLREFTVGAASGQVSRPPVIRRIRRRLARLRRRGG